MAKYNLKQLLKVTQKLLKKISHELENKNIHVNQALENVNKAVDSTQKHQLAEVEYKNTLDEILKDNDWGDHPDIFDMKPPKK